MTVMEALKLKHPEPQYPPESALIKRDTLPPRMDLMVTGAHVHSAASRIQGSAGPSGTDASHWQDVLLRYGAHSDRLRDSVATLARRLSNNIVPWDDIRAFVACRLIALDKCPGIRPIGIGETLRRIIGKTICSVTRYDLNDACDIAQLCGGVRCGIEAAIHAMSDLFNENEEDGWGVLMIDASNAFNSINRQAALWNVRVIWPSCSLFVFNTYRGWAPLVVTDSNEYLYSKEGVTQRDPLSMFVYAVATLPLIERIGHPNAGRDVWYADDASACAPLNDLLSWFSKLLSVGPSYGYYPESQKCVLVVSPDHLTAASDLFDSYGVTVTTSHRLLGGVVGDQSGSAEYVKGRVTEWSMIIEKLVLIAETQPQLSYSAYTRPIQSQWTYLQRVILECGSFFEPIETIITEQLIPTIFGSEISSKERSLFSLPTRMGGLNILNPVDIATHNYSTSRKITTPITNSLRNNTQFDMTEFIDYYDKVVKEISKEKDEDIQRMFDNIITEIDLIQQRAVLRAMEEKISSWLNVIPVAKHNFDLTAQEFRDSLAIRYKKPLLEVPPNCDGCNALFDLSHALSCRKGGLVTQRHNEVRDAFGDLASLAYSQVIKEPVVREAHNSFNSPALVADLSVHGVWMPQSEALFDIRIIDTDARSYCNRSPSEVLLTAEVEKKKKYHLACTERRAQFTPLCVSVDGMMGKEASVFVKRLSERLSMKWNQNYNNTLCWVRTRLTFAILRATILCLRGSRTKWRSINITDGSSLDLIMS